jgi:hypothetical protein
MFQAAWSSDFYSNTLVLRPRQKAEWQSMDAQWIQNGMQHGLMMFNDSSSMAELFCQCLLVFF